MRVDEQGGGLGWPTGHGDVGAMQNHGRARERRDETRKSGYGASQSEVGRELESGTHRRRNGAGEGIVGRAKKRVSERVVRIV